MTELSLITEVKDIDPLGAATWLNALALGIMIAIVSRLSLPLYEKFLLGLAGRIDAANLPRSFKQAWNGGARARLTIIPSLLYGAWIGVIGLVAPEAVEIHIGKELVRGLTSFEYLTLPGWIILGVIALFAGNLLGRLLELVPAYGKASILAMPVYFMLAMVSFWTGLLAWPLIIVVGLLVERSDVVFGPIRLGFSFLTPLARSIPTFSLGKHLFND